MTVTEFFIACDIIDTETVFVIFEDYVSYANDLAPVDFGTFDQISSESAGANVRKFRFSETENKIYMWVEEK